MVVARAERCTRFGDIRLPCAQVHWMSGAGHTYTERRLEGLQEAMAPHRRVVVLLDPDTAGRQGMPPLPLPLPRVTRCHAARTQHVFLPTHALPTLCGKC